MCVCVCVGARPKKGAEEAAQPKQDPLGAFSLIFYARSGTMMLEWHRNGTSCVPLCFGRADRDGGLLMAMGCKVRGKD